jgi:hypothetical protein
MRNGATSTGLNGLPLIQYRSTGLHVNKVVEKEDGSVTFQGVLEGVELAFVIEMGLETLIRAGALPFTSTENHLLSDIHEAPEDMQ